MRTAPFVLASLTSLVVAHAHATPAVAPSVPAKPTAPFAAPRNRVPGQALIRLAAPSKQQAALPATTAALKDLATRTGVDVRLVRPSVLGWLLVEVAVPGAGRPNEATTLQLVERLAADPAVDAVSDNKWMRALAVANDEFRANMWNLDIIGANSAWDVTKGTARQRIGIVDTGLIRQHEDVGAKGISGFDFISNVQQATDGNGRDADFQDTGDSCGGPDSFHGTHVAGTIAAETNNGSGIAGVNWNAQLVIVRALGACGGDIVDIMEGAYWLAGGQVAGVPDVGANRVSVMNLSLGSSSACSSYEQSIITEIDNAGVVFVAAAGNDGGPVGSPANCSGVVAVAAHGQTRALAPYSSFGSQIDIVAPGGDQQNFGQEGGILSTLGPRTVDYAFYEGTSMAAPHIAGIVSLLQAVDPTVNRARAEQLLTSTGVPCNGCGSKVAVDANAAVRAVGSTPPPDPTDPADPTDPTPPNPDQLVDDALEENDAAGLETLVPCGARLELVALPNDQDWFAVDVAPGAFALAIDAGDNDLDLYVVRNNTETLLASESPTGREALSATVGTAQRLQLVVHPFFNQQTGVAAKGGYTLSLDCVQDGEAPPAPDPTPPTPPEPPTPPSDPDTDPGDPADPDAPATDPADGADDDDDDRRRSGSAVSASGGCTQGGGAGPSTLLALGALLLLRRGRTAERRRPRT
jgi:serine protease